MRWNNDVSFRFGLMKQYPEADVSEEVMQTVHPEYKPTASEPVKRRRRRKQNVGFEMGGSRNGCVEK